MSLPDALERAASDLPADADAIRPANGDPIQLLELLDGAAATRVLGWLLEHEGDAAEELAAAWSEDTRGHAPLADVSDEGLPKPARKLLRRIRHRLRSSGVELGESEPAPGPRVARLPDVGDRLELAFVTGLDPRGACLVYVAESNPSGGARLYETVIDETRGIVDFDVYSAGRSKMRRFLKELRQRSRFSACEAEPGAARALIARALAVHPEAQPLPRAFAEHRARLTEGVADAVPPGDDLPEQLGDAPEAALLRRGAELVREGSIGPWPPEREVLTGLAEQLKQRAESPIIVSKSTRAEQVDSLLEETAAEVYGEDFGATTAARLRQSAYVFWKDAREEEARVCLAAARAFREMPPGENPVAKAMLEIALAPALGELLQDAANEDGAGGAAGEDEEPSLLVKPGGGG